MKKIRNIIDGELFEEFILENVFNPKDYDILEKSHPYNDKYYVLSNNNPDYKFKCKKTNRIFWIECKFKNEYNMYDDFLEFKESQFKRYKKLKEPVFYIIGTGVYVQCVEELSIIPYDEMYPKLFLSQFDKFKIPIDYISDFNELLELTTKKP
ncbi:hypothetical protein [uncultured Winogradskyella sp.]|uniref:hypothetical protein n=1 Tax=uncultured Winogradskyella sp. TaxID=395353 RepID=UPI00261C502D|nr:hypothetical protein [uncultured Winogradskyella sp.]